LKEEHINPFIESVIEVMEMMLDLSPESFPPVLKSEASMSGDISGIIGFASDEVTGAIALSFPEAAALFVYEQMMGETADGITSDVQDSVGELANMVVGGAKTIFSEQGLSFLISIPTIVVGLDHSLAYKQDIPIVVVPFKMEGHSFSMEISMKVEKH